MFYYLTDLKPNQIRQLCSIKTPSDITSASVMTTFEDDNISSATVKINNVPISFLWCGIKPIGACYYSKDNRAKKDIIKQLQATIHGGVCDMFDLCDEELEDKFEKYKLQYTTILAHIRSLHKNNYLRKDVTTYLSKCKVKCITELLD